MDHSSINSLDDFQNIINKYHAVCFYLSTPECSVCKVLKPKVIEMLKDVFPQIHYKMIF